MMADSQSSGTKIRQPLICNGMVNMFLWQQTNMQHRNYGSDVFYVILPRPYSDDGQSKVGGQSQQLVLSCTVRCHYQATASEDTEDLMFAVVICRVCGLVKLL
jgi:hypothetical protein